MPFCSHLTSFKPIQNASKKHYFLIPFSTQSLSSLSLELVFASEVYLTLTSISSLWIHLFKSTFSILDHVSHSFIFLLMHVFADLASKWQTERVLLNKTLVNYRSTV